MIGLKRGQVLLCPHEEAWHLAAEETIARLRPLLGDAAAEFAHVGSTAICHIAAKPIIDIAVAVPDLGRIMQMANLTQGMSFSREQTEEFIDTIFSEKQKQSGENIAQMDDAHFAAYLKARAGGKKGEE